MIVVLDLIYLILEIVETISQEVFNNGKYGATYGLSASRKYRIFGSIIGSTRSLGQGQREKDLLWFFKVETSLKYWGIDRLLKSMFYNKALTKLYDV